MQFRVSLPAGLYGSVSSKHFWPDGVRTRDFVNKRNNRPERVPVSSTQFNVETNIDVPSKPDDIRVNEVDMLTDPQTDETNSFLLNQPTTMVHTSQVESLE